MESGKKSGQSPAGLKGKKVLFNTSPGSFKTPGGGEIQMLETRRELERLGYSVKILEEEGYGIDFGGFDLFHNFNTHRDNYKYVTKAKQAGLPVAISTIYWPSLKSALLWNKGVKMKGKAVAAELAKRAGFFGLSKAREMVRAADVLLPNSMAEGKALKSVFGAACEKKIHVVPNGVDARFAKAGPKEFAERFGMKDFVLYVGRVEERKNVLSLIRAMEGVNEKLVVIGGPTANSQGYYEKCVREAPKNVQFLKPLLHNDSLLVSAYAACRVFALPSWYETPGLAALEAGLAGAGIVITKEGCTKEYFGAMASYADPASVRDIREKIIGALAVPKNRELGRHIEKNFLWENAARETARAYEKILGRN
jgi:glycosyltransferase involved in cell wall biosynthesis